MTELDWFAVTFREEFPIWERPPLNLSALSLNVNDTLTVAIIGEGRRTEVLIRAASGEGTEGAPVNFDPTNQPSARFFQTASFPVDASTFVVRRGTNGSEEVSSDDYLLQAETGQFVLFEPLTTGEALIVQYVSTSDINFPRLFTAENARDLYNIYGDPSSENTLSAGASLAFANGAPRVIAVQSDHTGTDPFSLGAYEALTRQQVYFIVPMQNGNYASQIAAGLDHVQLMSTTPRRRERFLLTSELLESDTANPNHYPREAAEDFGQEERILLAVGDFPTTVLSGETVAAGGGYLAAAVAGLWASSEYIAAPITNQEIVNITLNWPTRDIYTERQIRDFINGGITLLRPLSGSSRIIRGRTTMQNVTAVDEEPSVWRIRDYVAIQIRELLENRFTGTVVLSEVIDDVKTATEQFLKSMISQQLITKFSGIRVTVDSVEPRQVNVEFDIQPVFPLNDMDIRVRAVSFL